MTIDDTRRAAGRAAFETVYGGIVPPPPPGAAEGFELLVIDQQFAEVWTRPGLELRDRRLLTLGVLASVGNWGSFQIVSHAALAKAELTPQALREVAIHLISYLGTTKAGEIFAASERAIAAYEQPTSEDDR